jgi:hypothetical protein
MYGTSGGEHNAKEGQDSSSLPACLQEQMLGLGVDELDQLLVQLKV